VPGGSASFSYDAVGNRTDQSGAYGSANRIRQFAGCSYVTDSLGDGNVLSRTCGSEVVRFWWTAESRLAALKVVGGDSLDFRYDAYGRLCAKT
jgi:YD repeat-containing protein